VQPTKEKDDSFKGLLANQQFAGTVK